MTNTSPGCSRITKPVLLTIAKMLTLLPSDDCDLISVSKTAGTAGQIHLADQLFFNVFDFSEFTIHPSPSPSYNHVCIARFEEAPGVEVFTFTNEDLTRH